MKLTPTLILLRLPGSSEPNLGFGFKTLRASLGLGEGEKKEEGSRGGGGGRRRGCGTCPFLGHCGGAEGSGFIEPEGAKENFP